MEEIKNIAEDIRDELEGAEKYAMRALQYKPKSKNLTDTYAALAADELRHIDALHAQAVQLIKAQEVTPKPMDAVWGWEHENMVKGVAKIKYMLDMVRK